MLKQKVDFFRSVKKQKHDFSKLDFLGGRRPSKKHESTIKNLQVQQVRTESSTDEGSRIEPSPYFGGTENSLAFR